MNALITGGCGFVGLSLGRTLAQQGHTVTLVDLHPPPDVLPAGMHYISADIREMDDVIGAVTKARPELVFHVASYGMSGRESLHTQRIYDVNISGTTHLLTACHAVGCVRRLLYLSTYNVVFCGRPIVAGDESMDYADPAHVRDAYSRSKALAERMVLAANGMPLDAVALGEDQALAAKLGNHGGDGGTAAVQWSQRRGSRLLTCAIRPAGIYGPGEVRHSVRVIQMVRTGLFVSTFGDPHGRVDWVHIDNLVQALIRATEGLKAERDCIAAGQAYYISDDQPINNFEFFKPLIVGLGYPYPRLNVPYLLVYLVAWAMEAFSALLSPILEVVPLLSRVEVDKCAITHYFKVDKARQELGYRPEPHSMADVVPWYREAGYGSTAVRVPRRSQRLAMLALWTLFVALCVIIALFVLPRRVGV